MTLQESERLEELLASLGEVRSKLYPRAREFFDDIEARYSEHGAEMYMSPKQWAWLEDLAEQFT